MVRFFPFSWVVLFGVINPSPSWADPFTIDLEAHAAKETKTAHATIIPPDTKPQVRAVLTVSRNTPITVKWSLSNADPTATVKDVLVHFFVVQEEKTDQPIVPKLNKNVVAESALTMDFKPKDQTEGEITFTVPKPGCYLLRVETKGATGKNGHDYFAALDLVVR